MVFNYVSSSDEVSLEEIKYRFLQIPKILDLFEKIDIKRVKLKNNQFTILIDKDELYIDNNSINISANLNFKDSNLHMQVHSLYLKDLNLTFYGQSKIDASKEIINFFGHVDMDYVNAELNLNLEKNILQFYTNTTNSIKSLKFLKKLFRLESSVAEAWMYDNVEGDIDLKYLYGEIDLEEKNANLDSIKGEATITDAKIRFHKDVKTVNTSKLKVNYENDTLFFDLKEPVYGSSKIYGSKVYIPHLTSEKKGEVIVDLKTKSALNEDILEILNAYEINLPLKQLSGDSNSSLVLKIPYSPTRKMKIDGRFKLQDSKLKLQGFEFFTKNADVVLKNSDIYINDSQVEHKSLLKGVLNLHINTDTQTAKGKLALDSFQIKADKKSLINLSKKVVPFSLNFKEDTKIDLKTLSSKILIKDGVFSLKVDEIAHLYPYSELLRDLGIKLGNLKVDIKDEENISFEAFVKQLDLPLEKNTKKIQELKVFGEIKKTYTKIRTDDKDIEIILEDKNIPLVKLENIDVVLDESANSKKDTLPRINIHLKNSKLNLDNDNIYKVSYAKILLDKEKIDFEAEVLDLDLPLKKDKKDKKDIMSLDLKGFYTKDLIKLETKDKNILVNFFLDKNKIDINLKNYNLVYNTKKSLDDTNKEQLNYTIKAENSNIIIDNEYIMKADTFLLNSRKNSIDLKLDHKNTKFNFNKDSKKIVNIKAQNMSDEFFNALVNKELIKGGVINISANGNENSIKGEAFIKNSKIKDLAILNNLITLINTSPGLINPLLAIPSVVGMATRGGFNVNGYRVIDGRVDFSYNSKTKLLSMPKIFTKGNGVDFDGNAFIDFDKLAIDSKLKLIFFKNYSKIVGEIPVINYLFLGDEKRVDTQVEISGPLKDPKYKTNIAKDGVNAPVNFFRRLIETPKKIYDSINKE